MSRQAARPRGSSARKHAGLRVTAILAVYNEEDFIGATLEHLISQGIGAYLIDHSSTDGTVKEAARFLGRGLGKIERFPDESGFPAEDAGKFAWRDLLRRKQQLAEIIDADWFIHNDADELRESPWPHLNLQQAIAAVDRLGYNAIDSAVFNFWPGARGYRKGDDPLKSFRHCEPAREFDRLQIKCWKKTAAVDLVSSGGHEAAFAERRVFPVRFLCRHYPIRSQAQGARKVWKERLPRIDPAERAMGWHVQYDGLRPGQRLLRDPSGLTVYDPEQVRLQLFLRHRGVEELEARLGQERAACTEEAAKARHEVDSLRRELAARTEDVEWYRREWKVRDLETERAGMAQQRLETELRERVAELEDARRVHESAIESLRREHAAAVEGLRHEHGRGVANLRGELAAAEQARAEREALIQHMRSDIAQLQDTLMHREARIAELLASLSWRVAAPGRALYRLLKGE